ncbi:RNA helicase, partial [Dolichospermum circinale CS-537/05]|nr:RNA helicase [Dolichospermum circinale CS-537/05]
VLNLLQTHTIEKARELIERSFGQYMSNLHLQPDFEELGQFKDELAQIQRQLAAIDENELMVYEKLRQRLKVERQIFKTLQEQAQEDRKAQLAMMLDFAISGTMLSLQDRSSMSPLPITVVLIDKAVNFGEISYFVCLGQNNRWYVATSADILDMYAEMPRVEVPDNIIPPSELSLKRGHSIRGDESTITIAQSIPKPEEFNHLPTEVREQLSRLTAVQEQLENHPIYKSGNIAKIFKNRARCVELEAEIEHLEEQISLQSQRYWEEFLCLIEILQSFECLNNLIPTKLGEIAAAIRGENELWLGLVLASGELDNIGPHNLAAVVAALVTESPRPDTKVDFSLSTEADTAWLALQPIRRSVLKVQYRHGVALPVGLETRFISLISLVEQWALGVEWKVLCQKTTLDEGDVVRILRRTLDLLSQIPHVPNLPDVLRRNAQRAIQLIDRFPVNEAME